MLVSSFAFIGIYIYVYIRALLDDGRTFNERFTMPRRSPNREVPQPTVRYEPEQTIVTRNVVYSDAPSKSVICHNCGTTVVFSERF